MDKTFLKNDDKNIFFLDCTRLANSNKLVSRNNPNDVDGVYKQIIKLSNYFKSNNIKEIILADDVVFSGNVLKTIISEFKSNNIDVIGIRSSISTIDGYEYFSNNLSLGLKTGYLLDKYVIDQICERDFYYGIVQSGISVINDNDVLKAPYFLPFGEPNKRASIPKEDEIYFSLSCINRSKLIWKEIYKLSNNKFYNYDLPEKITFSDDNDLIVETLEKGEYELCKKYK